MWREGTEPPGSPATGGGDPGDRLEAEHGVLVLQGAEGQKPGFGYGGRAADYKSAHKGFRADAQSTLSRIFKLVT